MKEREVSGQEPPKAIAAAMKAADVVIVPTAQSLTHTNARIEAAKAGTRVATMPGITKEMFSRGAMTADYNEVEKLTAKVTEMLTGASRARIEKDGYVLNININGRNGVPSPGVYREAGKPDDHSTQKQKHPLLSSFFRKPQSAKLVIYQIGSQQKYHRIDGMCSHSRMKTSRQLADHSQKYRKG